MSNYSIISADITKTYEVLGKEFQKELEREIDNSNIRKIIVLDDDPTGTQTVHNVPIYTTWDQNTINAIFENSYKTNYILTNSRALTKEMTSKLHEEIAINISSVSKKFLFDYLLISRSDSTLRGHYPLETNILKVTLEKENSYMFDGEIICPFFSEAGRYTIQNVHYVKSGDRLIPVAKTEFAKDNTFGFKNSNLKEYIEEKTQGIFQSKDIIEITLDELVQMDLKSIEDKLVSVTNFNKVVVNATSDEHLNVFCIALYRSLNRGKKFLFRTAASFVRIVSGITLKDQICEFNKNESEVKGGIIVVGSHTNKTNQQIECVCERDYIVPILFNVNDDRDRLYSKSIEISDLCSKIIRSGKTPLVYTSREVLKSECKEEALQRSVAISDALQNVVKNLSIKPKFIIAKGGITSSDVATKALGVKVALVIGQAAPGVPVWELGENTLFPRIPFVVFPGNVGEADTLDIVVTNLIR